MTIFFKPILVTKLVLLNQFVIAFKTDDVDVYFRTVFA